LLRRRVVVVVSALSGETDRLDRMAHDICFNPDAACVARLLATGEAASAALVSIQLNACGVSAVPLDPHELRLLTSGPRLNADPLSIHRVAVDRAFDRASVIVVSGFVGCYEDGSPTLLGRGGSDATALFLAHELNAAECRLIKDVDGLYPEDPALKCGQQPFAEASWDTAMLCCGPLIQEKAVRYARSKNLPFRICALASRGGTWIGSPHDRFTGDKTSKPSQKEVLR
jgi:homoserine dehydrogenase